TVPSRTRSARARAGSSRRSRTAKATAAGPAAANKLPNSPPASPATAATAAASLWSSAARNAAAASSSSTTRSTASAAAGAAASAPASAGTAQAVADLAMLATRFAPAMAAGAGAIGDGESSVARGMHAGDIAQAAGRDGATAAAATTVAGSGAAGDPAPIVTAVRQFLASPGAEADSTKLLRALAGADAATVASALGQLPESDGLRLAGALLDALGDGSGLGAMQRQDLRHGVHRALADLGHSLQHGHGAGSGDELSTLRSVLEHVAATDPRPAVAGDAARLLAAADGAQVLSRTASGSDPGYVYFQVPMPNGRGAEVMVRREPGRRSVSFDEFNIAFLLDTERLGTLMIQLDAHPAGIRADVRTDRPALEPFLRDRTEALVEPLARESGRQVIVTSGVFDHEPPRSLLEPQLGAMTPGVNEFYA
ncbi:MAG: hypothetical protein JWM98_3356, partial [Thermoleophilia bacterium]|nr:hypothetical protein [Thermoleophilia bacterium]